MLAVASTFEVSKRLPSIENDKNPNSTLDYEPVQERDGIAVAEALLCHMAVEEALEDPRAVAKDRVAGLAGSAVEDIAVGVARGLGQGTTAAAVGCSHSACPHSAYYHFAYTHLAADAGERAAASDPAS